MKQLIRDIFKASIKTKEQTLEDNLEEIIRVIEVIAKTLKKGGCLFLFGNGGSAADSQHIAAEFIGRFKQERQSLPAIALTTDTSILTALGNDYGFDIVFARQLEGLAHKGDIAIGLSTSGNSPNVVEAMKVARQLGLVSISLTGNKGGKLSKMTDYSLVVPSDDTARIQESHICLAHTICELVEKQLSRIPS